MPRARSLDAHRRQTSQSLARQVREARQSLETDTRARVRRLKGKAWQIGQCSVGAGLAYWIATDVFGHRDAFFAPVATMVALGLNFGARLTRVVEVVLGVAIGVLVGDVLLLTLGNEPWVLPLVVAVAMSLAVLMGVGAILSTQAGVQAVLITVLMADPGAAFTRWLDALIGGGVALAIAAVVPRHPLRRPGLLARKAAMEVAELMREGTLALRHQDHARALRLLERARDEQQPIIDDLHAAAQTGLDVLRLAPWMHRGHRHELLRVAEVSEPLDHALRNTRVMLRRVVALTRRRSPVSEEQLALLDSFAKAAALVADGLTDDERMPAAQAALRKLAVQSSLVPVGQVLSADALLEGTRVMIVDLLRVTGLSLEECYAALPPVQGSWRTPPFGVPQVDADQDADQMDGDLVADLEDDPGSA